MYRQGLGEFFLDDLFDYEAGIVVPTPEVQAQLLPVLRDNARLAQLHTPAYSMVAYPWAQRYQQSNQWALETLAMARGARRHGPRERAQAWLQLQGYEPTTLRIWPLKRLGGAPDGAPTSPSTTTRTTSASADRIDTVTVDSVFAWLSAAGWAAPVQVIR